MAIVGEGVSIRVGPITAALLAGIAIGLAGAGFAVAQDARKPGAEAPKAPGTKTSRLPDRHKIATQKLMRYPWERTHLGRSNGRQR